MILVVDDEETLLTLLELRLEAAGYEILKARNGQEAIDIILKKKPDLITMDLMMPVMDGYEAIEEIRANPETADIPIIVLTALTDYESEQRCGRLGADMFLSKPFDPEFLLGKITELLKQPRNIKHLKS